MSLNSWLCNFLSCVILYPFLTIGHEKFTSIALKSGFRCRSGNFEFLNVFFLFLPYSYNKLDEYRFWRCSCPGEIKGCKNGMQSLTTIRQFGWMVRTVTLNSMFHSLIHTVKLCQNWTALKNKTCRPKLWILYNT